MAAACRRWHSAKGGMMPNCACELNRQHRPPLLRAIRTSRDRTHASSINSSGRVAESSPARNSYRRHRIYGYRIFLGRLDAWQHRPQTCGRPSQHRSRNSPDADLRGEVPAEQQCASKSGSPARNLYQLATGSVRGEGRLGDTAGSYLVRLRAGQGVCSEIDRSQSYIPMSGIALCDVDHIEKWRWPMISICLSRVGLF
jgi:hypothetical protein